eukprot:c44392_g1_i1 orf=3-185(-)
MLRQLNIQLHYFSDVHIDMLLNCIMDFTCEGFPYSKSLIFNHVCRYFKCAWSIKYNAHTEK